MDIYKIHVEHFSQKDSRSAIDCFVLAASGEDVYQWVDRERVYGLYTEKNEEEGLVEVYDSEYNVIGEETYKEKMLRIGGEFFDEDYEPEDCYYGVTIYGWSKLESSLLDIEISALEKLGVLKEIAPH